ncbi:DUF4476 domain-containing protein [Pontibacter sp. SGAir0037]|uniref:DUF4476 domain-containing protein n=1 Tax=Pontibacter sp. SGAir0037 TaxID=2571030 RepID=UPI0010CD2D71|nr:DUF4476 domain-containing protein [Pontibacter sp. SGAir0037]QCR24068.1 hypothetical protein C1N53_18045 [Pontibacter sp. SGAir0037]
MKKSLLPILLMLLVLPVLAQASVLTFTTQKGEPFQVMVNGRVVNHKAATFVRVANLRPGIHTVDFKIMGRFGMYRMGAKVAAEEGYETNYALRTTGRSGNVQLRRVSMVPLERPRIVVPVPQPAPVPRYPEYEPYEPTRPLPDYGRNDQCRNLLSRYDIDRLLESMRGRSFESTKQTIAREAIRSGSILSEDLKLVLLQFDHESTRAEFAKFAYDYVCDQERFYYVYDAFKFDSYVRELEEYTSRR